MSQLQGKIGPARTAPSALFVVALTLALLTGCGDSSTISKELALETFFSQKELAEMPDEEKKNFSIVEIDGKSPRFEKERSEYRQKHGELSGFAIVTIQRVARTTDEYFNHKGVVGREMTMTAGNIMYRLKDDTYWRMQEKPLSQNAVVTPLSPSEQVAYDEELAKKVAAEKVRIAEEAARKAEESRQSALRRNIKELERELGNTERSIAMARDDVINAQKSVDKQTDEAKHICARFPGSLNCNVLSNGYFMTSAKDRLANVRKYSDELQSKHKGLLEQITNLRKSL